MSSKKPAKLTREELIQRDKTLVARICSDEEFAVLFFQEKCRPLLSKILWTMFKDDTSYDDLVHDLYVHLRKPNAEGEYWHNLKTFNYETSLFDWIKTVATRLFLDPTGEMFQMPRSLILDGTLERILADMEDSKCRSYMENRYIHSMKSSELATLFGVDKNDVRKISRNSIKEFKAFLSERYTEYLSLFFIKVHKEPIESPKTRNLPGDDDTIRCVESKTDVRRYLSAMPNKRYERVLTALFLECKSPQELAEEFGVKVSNIYNLKMRSIEQVRDIAVLSGGIQGIEKYIPKLIDDNSRKLAQMIFINKECYDDIISDLKLTKNQFKTIKSRMLDELKQLIFS